MTTIEKIDFIIKTTKWSDRRFQKKFYLKKNSLEKWRNKEVEPMENDVRNICKYFHLEIKDFLDANKIIFLKNTDKFCFICAASLFLSTMSAANLSKFSLIFLSFKRSGTLILILWLFKIFE